MALADTDLSDSLKNTVSNGSSDRCEYEIDGVKYYGYLENVGNTGWKVLTALSESEYNAEYNSASITVITIFAVGTLIIILLTLVVSSTIVAPIKKLSRAMNSIADGALTTDVNITSIDETGKMGNSLRRTMKRLADYAAYIEEITDVLNKIAVGDLQYKLSQNYEGEFTKIKTALLYVNESMADTFEQVKTSSSVISDKSQLISTGAHDLYNGVTEQANSVSELERNISNISAQVENNVKNTKNAKDVAKTVAREIQDSNNKMQDMSKAMGDIKHTSDEIGKIIKTIDDIAFQTNILALNASVEAARAGAAGKGFAVVADEVRNLANKSAEAAKNSTTLIESSLSAVENGSRIVEVTVESMQAVVTGSDEVNKIIEAISSESANQALAISNVKDNVKTISDIVGNTSATVNNNVAASEQLEKQSNILIRVVDDFKY